MKTLQCWSPCFKLFEDLWRSKKAFAKLFTVNFLGGSYFSSPATSTMHSYSRSNKFLLANCSETTSRSSSMSSLSTLRLKLSASRCQSYTPWWHHPKLEQGSCCSHRCYHPSRNASVSSSAAAKAWAKVLLQVISLKSCYNALTHWLNQRWYSAGDLILGERSPIKGECSRMFSTINKIWPDWWGFVGWASLHTPKGHQFDSQLGHIQVQHGCIREATDHCFSFTWMFLSNINKNTLVCF